MRSFRRNVDLLAFQESVSFAEGKWGDGRLRWEMEALAALWVHISGKPFPTHQGTGGDGY